jgi:hypothetical protein
MKENQGSIKRVFKEQRKHSWPNNMNAWHKGEKPFRSFDELNGKQAVKFL